LVLFAFGVHAQNLTAAQAKDNVGKTVTVCSKVMSTYYSTKSRTTYLNLGAAYPNEDLTVVIFADDLHKFSETPGTLFANKNICVTGLVKLYKEKPEIVVTDPAKIVIK
jgi:micrococcal nuclease